MGQYALRRAGVIESQRCLTNSRMRKAQVVAEASKQGSKQGTAGSHGERERNKTLLKKWRRQPADFGVV